MVVNRWRCLHNWPSDQIFQPNWKWAGAVNRQTKQKQIKRKLCKFLFDRNHQFAYHWHLSSKALHFTEDSRLFVLNSPRRWWLWKKSFQFTFEALHVNWKSFHRHKSYSIITAEPPTMKSINYVIISPEVSFTPLCCAPQSASIIGGLIVGHLHNSRTGLKISLSWEFRFSSASLIIGREDIACGSEESEKWVIRHREPRALVGSVEK